MKKKLVIKRRSQRIKSSKTTWDKRLMHSLTVAVLFIAAFSHKAEMRADTGRGLFGGALTGAAIGGIAGGGKGAGYGALAGAALGGIIGSSKSRGSDPYRTLDRLERKLDKLQTKADKYRADINNASSDRRRERAQSRLRRTEGDIETTQNQISRMKDRLGVRQEPVRGGYNY